MGTSLCEPHTDIVYDVQGRKGPYAHYYIQVQPNGGSFVGMFDSPLFVFAETPEPRAVVELKRSAK